MTKRNNVFSDLKNQFIAWLKNRGENGVFAAASHYATNLEAIGNPIAPHSAIGAKWDGLYELLTGDKPIGVYQVHGLNEFVRNYGKAISFFSFETNSKEMIRGLYPSCKMFDQLFDYAHSTSKSKNGDGGHTRSAFNKYCMFLCELETKVKEDNLNGEVFGDFQQIFYGAPGTGKSHDVNEEAKKHPKEDVIRTTFHPDSDYSTFVGAYKPKMVELPRVVIADGSVSAITEGVPELLKEQKISYEFVPQAFAKAYVQAWKRMATPAADGKIAPVMLVIEEINRGDCAKVFGDLFQLLDRRVKDDANDPTKKAGFSEYPVLADADLADYIRRSLTNEEKAAISNVGYSQVVANEKLELVLPPNMYIWATMNTSDQSLFPMDSAFKRRWDWKYVPIKDEKQEWRIVVGEGNDKKEYDWWNFLEKVNALIDEVTSSEDKKLGYFFVKTADRVVTEDALVNKVFFFLWNDVFKDVVGQAELQFVDDKGTKDLKFRHFFKVNGKVDSVRIHDFLHEKLKVKYFEQQNAKVPGAAGGKNAEGNEGPGVEATPTDAQPEAPAPEV